jgi:hypothetical protein
MPLPQAREFKVAGGRQDTLHGWVLVASDQWRILDNQDFIAWQQSFPERVAAAPTVGEAMRTVGISHRNVFWDGHDYMIGHIETIHHEIIRPKETIWDRLVWLAKEGRLG